MCKDISMDAELRREIIRFLFPSFVDTSGRYAILDNIFPNKQTLLMNVKFDGDGNVFSSALLTTLQNYGADGGVHTVVTLLRGIAEQRGGDDPAEQAEKLIARLCGESVPAAGDKKPYVFVSYKRAGSSDFVQGLRLSLEACGMEVFLDVETISAGEFAAQIEPALERADVFVLCIGPNTVASFRPQGDWVVREYQHVKARGTTVIPVLHGGVSVNASDLPQGLDGLLANQRVQIHADQYQGGIDLLCKYIRDAMK